jgi:nucleotide-binding universal stress UspA family protein
MNNIVVAIDFSECSINAFLHALPIAQYCKCDLVLVWVETKVTDTEKHENNLIHHPKDAQKAFESLISKYRYRYPWIKISWKIRKGKIYKEITAEAKSSKAMMIIAGTLGAAGFEEFWTGSNATKIISSSSCPVITIWGGIDTTRPLKKILLPIDSAMETRQKAPFTGYLAKQHKAEIHILKLYTSRLKALRQTLDFYTAQVTAYFDDEKIKYQVNHVACENIADATIAYAAKIDANLISIMTEQETTTANLFLGPYAQQIVNHSRIPVLSIHPKDSLAQGTVWKTF